MSINYACNVFKPYLKNQENQVEDNPQIQISCNITNYLKIRLLQNPFPYRFKELNLTLRINYLNQNCIIDYNNKVMIIKLTSRIIHLHFKIKSIRKQKLLKRNLYLMNINLQNKENLRIL
ncbi:unnamed protein product [Paramecium primaurelia]|uniref:Uncharacterized protein n=1 Tax=Paramecium primaurelia TaxID=5886 RepID=A0A8S1K8Q1_PARPR|nr:unnamed protein product [Paramecium primaurelia]